MMSKILCIDPGVKMGIYVIENDIQTNTIINVGTTSKSKIAKILTLLKSIKPDEIWAEKPTSFANMNLGRSINSIKSQITISTIIETYCYLTNTKLKTVNQAKLFNWIKKSGFTRSKNEINSADDEDAYLVYRYFTEGGDQEYGYEEF